MFCPNLKTGSQNTKMAAKIRKTNITGFIIDLQSRVRVYSDRMRCDFFVANNRMRFTHASKKNK